jgi:uncharacterized membrane protein
MSFLIAYMCLFFPAITVTSQLRTLRGVQARYFLFHTLCFVVLVLVGFLAAPAALIGMALLLAIALWHAARELLYRHREVEFQRGHRQVRPRPPRGSHPKEQSL